MAAPGKEQAKDGEGARPSSRWRSLFGRLPTPVLVTIIGAALTAWLIPALTRQWQDQQRAQDLKAATVTRIARDTTEALVLSRFIAYQRIRGRSMPNGDVAFPQRAFDELDLEWEKDREEIETQLRAYFPRAPIFRQWRSYSQLVRDTYWLITERVYRRREAIEALQKLFPRNAHQIRLLGQPFVVCEREEIVSGARAERAGQAGAGERLCTFLPGTGGQKQAYYFVSLSLLRSKSRLTREILDTDPVGFSTSASDFFHDLVPFL